MERVADLQLEGKMDDTNFRNGISAIAIDSTLTSKVLMGESGMSLYTASINSNGAPELVKVQTMTGQTPAPHQPTSTMRAHMPRVCRATGAGEVYSQVWSHQWGYPCQAGRLQLLQVGCSGGRHYPSGRVNESACGLCQREGDVGRYAPV